MLTHAVVVRCGLNEGAVGVKGWKGRVSLVPLDLDLFDCEWISILRTSD